ncbi:MAG: zinc-binding dehydrogenase [Candidatus Krumholzibacteriota bacterium]|nr:zinc-binding dehydrogenase [Candidatus Krumholzibacteriota bacterium]
MKAVFFDKHGGPEVLRYGDIEDPVPGGGEVLIDVKASSLNHLDIFVRRGIPGIRLPHIPGSDASGVVAAVGDGVTGVSVGERVLVNPAFSCGWCEFCIRGDHSMCRSFKILGEQVRGACCEKLVVPGENVIAIPESMSFTDAAAVPLVFVTSWRMLITRGRLRAGETVLVLGAASGVGTACIQIAKVAGARVIACAGGDEKLKICAELGADVLIDHTREDFSKRVREETGKRGVDVCVDHVGKDTWAKSVQSLAKGGRLVTCGATTGYEATTDLRHVFFRQLEVIGSTMGSKVELLAALRLIFDGKMRAVVGKVVDLGNTAEAHRMMEARKVIGKIVIRVGE